MRPSGIFKELWAILMAGTLLTACNSVPVRFGPEEGEEYDVTQPRTVSGEAWEAGKDYIADIKVLEEWTYAFPGTLYCTYMEATAYPRGKT